VLNRVISNLYDAVLKPFGITVNQTTILAMLTLVSEARPGRIGKELHMEKSTISRMIDNDFATGLANLKALVGNKQEVTSCRRSHLSCGSTISRKFYEKVFATKLQNLKAPFPGIELWAFPMEQNH